MNLQVKMALPGCVERSGQYMLRQCKCFIAISISDSINTIKAVCRNGLGNRKNGRENFIFHTNEMDGFLSELLNQMYDIPHARNSIEQ